MLPRYIINPQSGGQVNMSLYKIQFLLNFLRGLIFLLSLKKKLNEKTDSFISLYPLSANQ